MPHEMFGQVTHPSTGNYRKRWYTLPLSILTHALMLLALVVAPVVASSILPTPQSVLAFVTAPAPPETPPLPPKTSQPLPPEPAAVDRTAAPVVEPAAITPEPPPRMPVLVADVQTDPRLVNPVVATFPPPLPPPAPVPPQRVGGDIRPPTIVTRVDPIYPPVAKAAKVQGTVFIEATIAKDGRVINARALKPVPLLEQAALDAVSQWRFTPTLLNGEPIEVVMTVTVNFRLQ